MRKDKKVPVPGEEGQGPVELLEKFRKKFDEVRPIIENEPGNEPGNRRTDDSSNDIIKRLLYSIYGILLALCVLLGFLNGMVFVCVIRLLS